MWSRAWRRCGSRSSATALHIVLGILMGTVPVTLSGYDLRLWSTESPVARMEMSASAGLPPHPVVDPAPHIWGGPHEGHLPRADRSTGRQPFSGVRRTGRIGPNGGRTHRSRD